MAFSTGYVASFKWGAGSAELGSYIKSVDINAKRDIKKLPRMNGQQTAQLPGPVDIEIKVEGWYDPTIAGTFAPLSFSTALVSYPFQFAMYGGTAELYWGSAYVGSFNPNADSEEPDKFTLTLAIDQYGLSYNAGA